MVIMTGKNTVIFEKSRCLAPQKEFESPTFRLGGGRSILLSYWGMCVIYSTQILLPCQENTARFSEYPY